MGQISDVIPPLYHEGKNEIIPFTKALDASTDWNSDLWAQLSP
jgi:hypothetical protein